MSAEWHIFEQWEASGESWYVSAHALRVRDSDDTRLNSAVRHSDLGHIGLAMEIGVEAGCRGPKVSWRLKLLGNQLLRSGQRVSAVPCRLHHRRNL